MNGLLIPTCNPQGSFASIRCECHDRDDVKKYEYPTPPACKNRVAHVSEGWC